MIGSWDASSALTTKPAKAGTVLPATCSTGEAFFNTAAAGGQNFYLCKPDNTWTQLTTGGSSVNITTSCGVTGGPITGTGALSGSISLDLETGASAFAIPTTDCATVIYRNNAAAVSDTIARAGTGGNFPSGWFAWYQCAGAGGCTITPATSTINGASSLVLPSGASVMIQSNGTNYTAMGDVRAIPPVVTTVGTPGSDTNVPSEKAVRTAIGAAGVAPYSCTVTAVAATGPYTDLATDSSNPALVSSASHNFVAADQYKQLVISGGSGFTPGTYTIVSVGSNKATLSASAGGTSLTGGSYSVAPQIACTHNLGTSDPWAVCYDGGGNMLGSTGASTSVTSVVATSSSVATIAFTGTTTATCLIATGGMGPTGATGAAGAAGANGQSVTATVENAGANCTYGGWKLVSVSGTSFVCNGAPGSGSGTVTSITAAAPLTGGTITTTGTIGLDTTHVPQKFFGTAAPGSVTGNLPGDAYTDTTNHHQYVCNAPSGTAAPACTAVATAGWLRVDGSGSGTVTSVATAFPLTGGPITGSGTISLAAVNSGVSTTLDYTPFGISTSCSNTPITASNQIILRSFIPPYSMTLNQVRQYVGVVNPSGGANRFGIYSSAGSLLGQSAADTSTSGVTVKTYAMSPSLSLVAGTRYFLAWGADQNTVATCTTGAAGDATLYNQGVTETILTKTIYTTTLATCSCGSGGSFTLPSTFSGFNGTTFAPGGWLAVWSVRFN
jgi:hypothetical protein